MEDYLSAGNALGYNQNWRYRYSGGELLMMTASGEPSAYYPMDSNGLAVQNAPAQPCICAVVAPVSVSVCLPLLGFATCEIVGYEVCVVYSVCPQDQKEPPFKIKKPCNPDTLTKECPKKCQGKGIPVGCAILEVKVGSIQREAPVCLCLNGCTPEQLEKCKEECKSKGKPLYGCVDPNPVSDDILFGPILGIIGVPKCFCEPTLPL